jgi:transcriptional regulator with XRE-family HTH domain
LTPTEYRDTLKRLGLNQAEAARFCGYHPVTGRKWAAGGPPPGVAKLFRLMMALKFTPDYVNGVLGDE